MNRSVLLAAALAACATTAQGAVCPLPDLSQLAAPESPAPFELVEAEDSSLRLRMTNHVADPPELLPAEPPRGPPARPIPAQLRWLYSEATGWLQVPRTLEVRVAGVGVDGSWTLRMDDGRGARLWASSTGSCMGCAVSAGSGWFPALTQQARGLEIEPCTVFRPQPQRVPQGSTRVRYNYQASGVRHDGVVTWQSGRDELGDVRQLLVIGLPQSVRDAVLLRF